MANRRTSWRRATSAQQHRRPSKNQPISFSGIEDQALLTLFTHLLAKKVNVNAVNGAVYTGLFAGTQHSSNNDLLLTLRFATLVRGKPVPSATVHDLRGTTASRIVIPFSRITTVLGAPVEGKKPFATDAQITKGSTGAGRQLQRFEDFESVKPDVGAGVDQHTFGSLASNARDKWDQFHVNQTKFGVTTSFDETQYTTTIDRTSKDFAQRQREADRLAEEIEATPSQNIHVREERNQDIGNDVDEETRYSGVQRPQSTHQTPRPQPAPKDPVPERPRLSYAAAAAAAANVDPRQHLLSKPPSAGATNIASANKTAQQNKNTAAASKPSASANSRHSQQTGKSSQDQPAKHSQSASRGSHSASAKNASTNAKAQPQTPKSANRKGPAAANKQQQHQGKNTGTSNKPSNQASGNKSASQPATTRSSAPAVNPKTSGSTVHAKTPTASTRTTAPSQSPATTQEQPQAKSSSSKTTAQASVTNKDKPAEEKPKAVAKDRASRDNLPQVVKARAALAGRTSPNQSRNSPLPAPAVTDTSAIGVLNLDAQTPNLGPEQIKRFEAYKTNREYQSITANREKITDDLKKFSTQLDSKNGTLRRGQSSGSSTPGTPRAKATATPRNIPEIVTAEKVAEIAAKKDVTTVKDDIQKDKPRVEAEAKVVKEPDTKPADKPEEAAPKPRPKPKSKLNPNAQEFKLNPDAPSFSPAPQQAQPQSPVQYAAMYNQPGDHVEYSQQIQLPPGYAMPIQAMTPIPYAPQSYVVVPTVPGPVAGGGGSAYPFVQQPPSFAPAHVGGRFPQSAGIPVSYAYPPQVTPIMIPPGQQRVPTSPYYNSGPYVSAPHQAHLYQQGPAPHLQGGAMPMAGRGGHGNARRGGANRSRGKTSFQQSYPHVQASGDRSAPKSPDGARSPGGTQR